MFTKTGIYRAISVVTAAALVCLAATPAFARGEGEATGEEELRRITFMLDWVPNVNHTGIYAAQENGYFRESGLEVRIIQPGEVNAVSAVVSGRADFGVGFQEEVTILRTEEVPVVSVAAMLQTNTSGFAVRADEGIDAPADFEGLSYATFQSQFEEPTLNSLVRCAGGDPTTINFVPAGTDLLAMLQQKKADIAWIFYGTQGFQAQRIGLDIEYFPLNEYTDCIPDYYTPVIIASEEMLEDDPELVRSFLAALSRGHQFVMNNPEEAATILSEAVAELNAGQLQKSVPWLSERMKMDAPQWGHQERSVWEEYMQWMIDVGVLDSPIDVDAAFTNAYLPGN